MDGAKLEGMIEKAGADQRPGCAKRRYRAACVDKLKSGTNKLHGSSFMYGTNELLDANIGTTIAWDRKRQAPSWGLRLQLSGPIHKNKTFIFGPLRDLRYNDFRT